MNALLAAALQQARRAEKEQALFYRALAACAEQAGDDQAAEDLNGLLADEQHHLSRLTARLLEADQSIANLNDVRAPAVAYPEWQPLARAREQAEIERYETLVRLELDTLTAALITEIVAAEREHARTLGGKYMSA
ncbi:MAG: ferritin family protein [Longimicrobiales bacterium]